MKYIYTLIIAICCQTIFGQSTTITPGTVLPQITTIERESLIEPLSGMMVFDTDFQAVVMFDGQNWLPFLNVANFDQLSPINRNTNNASSFSRFGNSVAISGDYAIIGARRDRFFYKGSAFVFKRVNGSWQEHSKLIANDTDDNDEFGVSVDISGDYAIIGAYRNNSWKGAAYIFKRDGNNWIQQVKLTPNDVLPPQMHFGYSVAISGDNAIIGAKNDNIGSNNFQGSAYVFKRDGGTWLQEAKLIASDGTSSDRFGSSVDISGNYAIIGAPNAYGGVGRAYIFENTTGSWLQEDILGENYISSTTNFGHSVSISGTEAVVGAFNYENQRGLLDYYVKVGSTWDGLSGYLSEFITAGDKTGFSVSMSGNYIIVGAPGSSGNKGAAYILKNRKFIKKVEDISGKVDDMFGGATAISEKGIYLIGAEQKDGNAGGVSFGKVR